MFCSGDCLLGVSQLQILEQLLEIKAFMAFKPKFRSDAFDESIQHLLTNETRWCESYFPPCSIGEMPKNVARSSAKLLGLLQAVRKLSKPRPLG